MSPVLQLIRQRLDELEVEREKHRYLTYIITTEITKLRKMLKTPPVSPDWRPATRYENERTRLIGALLPPEE